MTNRRRNRIARWIGNVLLISGAMALGVWAFSFFGLTIWQHWQNREFEQRRAFNPQTAAQPHPERRRIRNGEVIGRLEIPRLHLHAMIREGDGDRTLNLALGHIPGTALPGQPGNIGIAGHRDRLFRGLRHIAPNDRITFETADANYVYRVQSTEVVKPQDVGVLRPGRTPELTLVTCFPFEYIGAAPNRFIVKAQLVSGNLAANQTPEKVESATPTPVEPKPVVRVLPVHGQIGFDVAEGHSRELIPGKIWFGLSSADASRKTVDGWVWVMPDRRTIWLRDVDARQPVVFYQDGGKRELVITSIARSSARGYLAPSPRPDAPDGEPHATIDR